MKILLGTDGSSYSREASRFLNDLLHPDARVHVDIVAVASIPGENRDDEEGGPRGFRFVDADGTRTVSPHEWLAIARDELTGPQITAEEFVLVGDPAEVMVERAATGRYDLVVAGVKGCGATPFFELGRVARALLHAGGPSTLLVRKGGGGYSRENGTSGRRKLRALMATALDRDSRDEEWSPLSSFSLAEDQIPVVDLAGRDGHQPIREIDRQARKLEADVVILETVPTSPIDGPSSRSAARTTVWTAPCSVLVIRRATPLGLEAELPLSGRFPQGSRTREEGKQFS